MSMILLLNWALQWSPTYLDAWHIIQSQLIVYHFCLSFANWVGERVRGGRWASGWLWESVWRILGQRLNGEDSCDSLTCQNWIIPRPWWHTPFTCVEVRRHTLSMACMSSFYNARCTHGVYIFRRAHIFSVLIQGRMAGSKVIGPASGSW